MRSSSIVHPLFLVINHQSCEGLRDIFAVVVTVVVAVDVRQIETVNDRQNERGAIAASAVIVAFGSKTEEAQHIAQEELLGANYQ